jgi:hypothetical protein
MSNADTATTPTALAPIGEATTASLSTGSLWLSPQSFEHVQRVAKLFSESSMVPEHYRKNLPNCAIAVQLAFRLDVDPYMLMQRTYIVHGRPGMEAQLVIALVNARGPFSGPIRWRFEGQAGADTWQCTAYANLRNGGGLCEATVDWRMVKAEGWLDKAGSKWKSMPTLMFQYRSATFLARLYCPEVIAGMPTVDELADMGAIPTTARPVSPAPADDGAVTVGPAVATTTEQQQ